MSSNPEIVHELPMRWADLDSLNHVNNVVYVDYAAECRAMLVDDGVLAAGRDITRMSVTYARPLLLSRHPVQVATAIEPDSVTQEIRADRDGERVVYAIVRTWLGTRTPRPRAEVTIDPLPVRIRRSDLDGADTVGAAKTFELFQEGRILFISGHLSGMGAGQFVVGTVTVDFHEPISWRREPYQVRGWINRVGNASVTIESELSDGDVVLASAESVLVGFNLAEQTSRTFSADERAVFERLRPATG